MVAVGVRQLKNQLTRYLRLAEKGYAGPLSKEK